MRAALRFSAYPVNPHIAPLELRRVHKSVLLRGIVRTRQISPDFIWSRLRGWANTTITVLRVPASVSEYGWMLENSHFVYMWTRESAFITGFWPIRFLNCIGVHKILNILKCKHWWAHEYFLCYGWNFLKRSILLLIHPWHLTKNTVSIKHIQTVLESGKTGEGGRGIYLHIKKVPHPFPAPYKWVFLL